MFGTLCCLYRSSWAIMQNKSWKVVKKKKLNSRWMAHLCFVRGCEKRIMGVWGEHFMLSLLVKRRDFWAFMILFSFWIFFSTFCVTMNECKKRINKYGFFFVVGKSPVSVLGLNSHCNCLVGPTKSSVRHCCHYFDS